MAENMGKAAKAELRAVDGGVYIIDKARPLSSGGKCNVWEARRHGEDQLYACKLFENISCDYSDFRRNIEVLLRCATEERVLRAIDGRSLDSLIIPITYIARDCCFGYIMPLVDLKGFVTVDDAWGTPDNRPTAQAVCRIVWELAEVFRALNMRYGLYCKRFEAEKLFFHPQTGEVRLIATDNIGPPEIPVEQGVPGYMAPELELRLCDPDQFSDRYAFAVYLYRLLTNGHPFQGPHFDQYCKEHDLLPYDEEVREELYGRNPLFAWHPTDQRNCPDRSDEYITQSLMWRSIPPSIQELFAQTFVANVSFSRRVERTTYRQWKQAFGRLEENLITCPHCGRQTFPDTELCFVCNEAMAAQSGRTTKATVVFTVCSPTEGVKRIRCAEGTRWSADRISTELTPGEWFEILTSENGALSIKNISGETWLCRAASGALSQCGPNQVIALEKTQTIALVTKRVNLQVVDLIK